MFAGDRVNPALEALGHLPPRLGTLEIATRVLPAVFGEALDALEAAIRETTPDIVLCVGLAGMDLGAFSVMLWAFIEREKLYDVFELASGRSW